MVINGSGDSPSSAALGAPIPQRRVPTQPDQVGNLHTVNQVPSGSGDLLTLYCFHSRFH